MEFSAQIAQFIASQGALKIQATNAPVEANPEFPSILANFMDDNQVTTPAAAAKSTNVHAESATQLPDWVDPNYGYDPANPRKPNMREFMQALCGCSVEALYADENSNWHKTSRQASDLLYGVLCSNEDTRDWDKIMRADDIQYAAREATSAMYMPVVDIAWIRNDKGMLLTQVAAVCDAHGNILRTLSGGVDDVYETLENFGATSASIPEDLSSRIVVDDFSDALLDALVNFKSQYEGEALAMVADPDAASSTADFLSDRASA